jgi:hypothetical protein
MHCGKAHDSCNNIHTGYNFGHQRRQAAPVYLDTEVPRPGLRQHQFWAQSLAVHAC